jgi:cyclic pyranopterin phosphate synthase
MLQDTHGRLFPYLRLSVTDACNFRCGYCLPNGYQKPQGCAPFLNQSEIRQLVTAFASLGGKKVRLTGGEPTLRRDIVDITAMIAQTPGIETVALSTNGYRLEHLASQFYEAGLKSINVSIDSLDPQRFADFTGQDLLPRVLGGIDRALELPFKSVKVNSVLMRDTYDEELDRFSEWIRHRPVTVRWIELMPTGGNAQFFQSHFISSETLKQKILARGWLPIPREVDSGPAQEYLHPEYLGRLGLIAPYARNFCQSCNRLRVTSRGGLRLCLFGDGEQDLRPLMQESLQLLELTQTIERALIGKAVSHSLDKGSFGNNQTFSAMGG